MTVEEWAKLLRSYRSVKRVVNESLEGIIDHIETSCRSGKKMTLATIGAGARGLPPFHEELTVCDRGTHGCNLQHHDGQALLFARMSLERIKELNDKMKG